MATRHPLSASLSLSLSREGRERHFAITWLLTTRDDPGLIVGSLGRAR